MSLKPPYAFAMLHSPCSNDERNDIALLSAGSFSVHWNNLSIFFVSISLCHCSVLDIFFILSFSFSLFSSLLRCPFHVHMVKITNAWINCTVGPRLDSRTSLDCSLLDPPRSLLFLHDDVDTGAHWLERRKPSRFSAAISTSTYLHSKGSLAGWLLWRSSGQERRRRRRRRCLLNP